MKFSEILKEDKPRSIGRPGQPYWELDVDNKVYVVYDENGKEVSRHTFPAIWDSSKARNAAQKDVNDLFTRAAENDKKNKESSPLNDYEKEYAKLSHDNEEYYRLLFPVKGAGYNPNFSKEQIQSIEQEMEKNHKRMMLLQNPMLDRVRQSVILGTYKPPQ